MQSILEPGSDMMGTEFGVGSSACTGCNARGKSEGRRVQLLRRRVQSRDGSRWGADSGGPWNRGRVNARNILKQVISGQGTAESTGDLFLPR